MPTRPLFIIGTPRSGTELMRQILNRHPTVLIAPETHYFDDLRARIPATARTRPGPHVQQRAAGYFAKLCAGPYGTNGTEWVGRRQADALAACASLDAMFEAHCRGHAAPMGKDDTQLQVWGEKTPRHVFCIAEILDAFPDALFIYMMRDPRAVVASYRDWTNHYIDPQAASAPLKAALASEAARVRRSYSTGVTALLWRASFATARHWHARLGEKRFRIQSYEALLEAPEAQIGGICGMLGLVPDPAKRQVGRLNSSYGNDGSAGIDQTAAQAWRHRMSDRQIWVVERFCRGPMVKAGYPRASHGAHPAAFCAELLRMLWRIPLAFAANRHRIGNPLLWTMRRAGLRRSG